MTLVQVRAFYKDGDDYVTTCKLKNAWRYIGKYLKSQPKKDLVRLLRVEVFSDEGKGYFRTYNSLSLFKAFHISIKEEL